MTCIKPNTILIGLKIYLRIEQLKWNILKITDGYEQEGTIWSNPNLTIEFIEKWIYDQFSIKRHDKLKYISCCNNPDLMSLMDWDYISFNPGIKMIDIETHHEFPWVWDSVSRNPNLTYEFVNKHFDKLNWKEISRNDFSGNDW